MPDYLSLKASFRVKDSHLQFLKDGWIPGDIATLATYILLDAGYGSEGDSDDSGGGIFREILSSSKEQHELYDDLSEEDKQRYNEYKQLAEEYKDLIKYWVRLDLRPYLCIAFDPTIEDQSVWKFQFDKRVWLAQEEDYIGFMENIIGFIASELIYCIILNDYTGSVIDYRFDKKDNIPFLVESYKGGDQHKVKVAPWRKINNII